MHQIERDVTKTSAIEEGTETNNFLPIKAPEGFLDTPQVNTIEKEGERVAKDVFSGKYSLINLLLDAAKIRKPIEDLVKNNPDLVDMDEYVLKEKYKEHITLPVQRIRVALWQEYETAIYKKTPMRTHQIFAGTCSEIAFYKMISDPIALAYIIKAPADYIIMLKEAHVAGFEQLRKLLDAKVVDENGWINPKSADIVLKAVALLDARLKGAVIQRIDQRTLNANITVKDKTSPDAEIPINMEALENELQRVKALQAGQSKALPEPASSREATEIESKEI